MKVLKFISNMFYNRKTYFGYRCSGYGCYPTGVKDTGIVYKVLVEGRKCGGCEDTLYK